MNTSRYILVVMLAVLAVFSSPSLASNFTFTEEDNGKTFHVNPGDTITVTLIGNTGTGMEWIMDINRGLVLKSQEDIRGNYYMEPHIFIWNYVISESGVLTISAIYKQTIFLKFFGEGERNFTLTLISGERDYLNSRTQYWWDIVPKFERISVAIDKTRNIAHGVNPYRFPHRWNDKYLYDLFYKFFL